MRILLTLMISTALAAATAAQSGRRVASPSPTPAPAEEKNYSETVPLKKRPPRISPLFRGIGLNAERQAQASAATTDAVVDTGDTDLIRVETNLVTIPVSVFDRNGLYIPGLTKDNFTIFDNGVEQEIEYFRTTETPFTVVLLIDTSPSTDYKIDEIREAARAFVDQLQPQDRVAVIEFDGDPQVLTPATGDRQAIFRAIKRADFGGGTALYDAVDVALRDHLAAIDGRKAVVLFTDGVDTASVRANYDSTLDLAEEFDALIFPVYYNTYFGSTQTAPSSWPFPSTVTLGAGNSASEYAVGKKYLEELAAYTGGRVYQAESTPGGLTAAFAGIAEELRRQYNIGYIPSEDGRPGQRRSIRVRVDRPNLIVRSRDAYIVGAK